MKNFLIGLLCLFAVSAWAAQPRVSGVEVIQALNGTATNTTFPTNTFAIGTIYSGRGAYAFYGDDEELLWGGIRTNSTLARLALYAYRGTASSGSNTHLLIEGQNDNYGLFEFGGSPNGANFTAETTASQIDFSIKYGAIQKVFMRANTSGGFIGINTNNPQAALHVVGGAIISGTATLQGPFVRAQQRVGDANLDVLSTNVLAFATNNSFTQSFVGTPIVGQLITFSGSNYSAATIYGTNVQGFRQLSSATNENLLVLDPGITEFDFIWQTTFVGAGEWVLIARRGPEKTLTFGSGIVATTNGLAVSIASSSSQWFTNGHVVTATNTSSFTDFLDVTIPAGIMSTNSTLEISLRGRYHNATSAFSPTNILTFGGSNVMTWTNNVLANNNANQWRPWRTDIQIINMDSTALQSSDVLQLVGGAAGTFPDSGLLAVGTTFNGVIMKQAQFAFSTSTNNQLKFSVALTNGTCSLVVYSALVRITR